MRNFQYIKSFKAFRMYPRDLVSKRPQPFRILKSLKLYLVLDIHTPNARGKKEVSAVSPLSRCSACVVEEGGRPCAACRTGSAGKTPGTGCADS